MRGSIVLLLTAVIWGAGFVAQKIGIIELDVFTFNAVRFYVSGFALLPIILFNRYKRKETVQVAYKHRQRKQLLIGGFFCGLCLCTASLAQQIGLVDTSAGKAGFITALYIILVPVLGLFVGKKSSPAIWLSVLVAMAGFYLLCVHDGLSLGKGDAVMLVSALLYAVHIMVIDYYSPKTDSIKLSCIQFFVTAVISTVLMLIFDKPSISAILSSWAPVLYLGVISGGIGYTLQIIGQKNTNPTIASMILSTEAVFAAIAGVLFLEEGFTLEELAGCLLVFGAIIWSQIAVSKAARTQKLSPDVDAKQIMINSDK